MKQFRPIHYPKRCRLGKISKYDLKFRNRITDCPLMIRIFSKLHYLGSHSYVQEKWYRVEQKFLNRHRSLDL